MKSQPPKKSHLSAITEAAKQAKLKIEVITKGDEGKTLKISNGEAFCLFNGNHLGFYPTTSRWFATLTDSKILSEIVLSDLGYSVIAGEAYEAKQYPAWSQLETRLKQHSIFPAIIKPELGLKGRGIVVIESQRKLLSTAKKLYRSGSGFLLQEIVMQTEFRILVVNKQVLFMHSKAFPSVTGNGVKTAKQLFEEVEKDKDRTFFTSNLRQLGLRANSIVPKGAEIPYHITRKGSFEYVYDSKQIRAGARRWALEVARKLQTPTVGIDVFIDGDFDNSNSYKIIEINANPGFMYINHKYQRPRVVKQVCDEIIKSYFK